MGIFDRFPYSSTHEMNLDFMLGKATEIAEDMQQVTAGMEQVQAGLTAISEKTEQATQAAAQAAASASSIEGSVTAAEEAAEESQMHNESAQTWANNALTYKADCQRAATEAAASSSSAAQAATAAAASEDTVAQYAQAANASAQSAANNNDSAHQYANQASASASNATFHSSNAQTAATNANTSATNAETAATNASASADRAASLKTDVETLHRMCVAAVDQAATEAVNAANSAAQAAATKTDVETLVESLPEDFTDLNNTVNQLSDNIDDITSNFQLVESKNVYDASTAEEGIKQPDGTITQTTNYLYSVLIAVKPGDTLRSYYLNEANNTIYPANMNRVCAYDSQKNVVSNAGADSVSTSYTVPDGIYFVSITLANGVYRTAIITKNDTVAPTEYIAYFEPYYVAKPEFIKSAVANSLYGKIAVFDGDSICAGLGSAMGNYGNGWAGRVGVDNDMEWYNVGVSGACITAETYFSSGSARHWISRYIDTIHENYPDADYVIGEGGTNDADNFYSTPEKLGTFSETDFTGPFDDTTFYGAMDSWCKKALTYFPKAKIGFIVAQKMGLGFATYTKNRYDYFTYAEKVCKKWGIPVLNLWDMGQLRPDVTSMYDPQYNTIETATEHGLPYYDGQHLTAYGYDIISSKIAEWMRGL